MITAAGNNPVIYALFLCMIAMIVFSLETLSSNTIKEMHFFMYNQYSIYMTFFGDITVSHTMSDSSSIYKSVR